MDLRRLRIGFLNARDSTDRRAWSGVLWSMSDALERHCGEGRTLEAAVAEQMPLEAERSQSRQRRQDARPVVRVGRMQFEIEERAMLVAGDEQLDALDQLAAINAPRPGARG